MGERDAFGREKGEDTLAGLGWQVPSGSPPPQPPPSQPQPQVSSMAVPAAAAEPAAETDPPPAWTAGPVVARPRRRRRRLPVVRLVLLVAIVGGVIVGAGSILDRGREALDDVQGALKDATAAAIPTPAPAPPVGVESGSLLRPAALRSALKKLPDGSIQSLRVAPDRIDAQVSSGGKTHVVQVTSAGAVRSTTIPIKGQGKGARVDAGAPLRIARTASRRSRRDPARVSYLVLMDISGAAEWQLFFDDGLHYSASANGRKVRRVG